MKNIVDSKTCLACKRCCYFENKEDAKLAPFFSPKEIKRIGKKKSGLVKNKNGFFQARTVKAKNKRGYFCIFLNQKNYKCRIYENIPLDCSAWPFVIGYDKDKKEIFLWIVNKKYCPYADSKKIKRDDIDEMVAFLKKKGTPEEIKNKKRFVWPYENYQIKIRKI